MLCGSQKGDWWPVPSAKHRWGERDTLFRQTHAVGKKVPSHGALPLPGIANRHQGVGELCVPSTQANWGQRVNEGKELGLDRGLFRKCLLWSQCLSTYRLGVQRERDRDWISTEKSFLSSPSAGIASRVTVSCSYLFHPPWGRWFNTY